jgi:hypothetical protein
VFVLTEGRKNLRICLDASKQHPPTEVDTESIGFPTLLVGFASYRLSLS